jgi:hypothetical protein
MAATSNKRRHKRDRIDPLIAELKHEIIKLVAGVFEAINAGERPCISLKGVLDALTRLQTEAGRP